MKLFRRKKFEAEMDDELRFHIDAYIADLVRSGVDLQAAKRRARAEFGAIEAKKDECRQAWGMQWLDELRGDLRLTGRTLRQHPGFAAVAILSLALGIGANTAIFGLIDAVVLRMLPVHDPERLVFVYAEGTSGPNGAPPYPGFELLRDKTKTFAGMAAFSGSSMELVIDAEREQVRGLWVSGNFHELLGVKPIRGRGLSAADDQTIGRGGPDGPVAVISESYWSRRFGRNPSVLGRAVRMHDHSLTIVGIIPDSGISVNPGRPIDIAVPMMLSDAQTLRSKDSWWLEIVGRLQPGIRPEQARAEANSVFQSFMKDLTMPPAIRKLYFDHIGLVPAGQGQDGLRKQFSQPLAALMVLAGLVLLAACVNVANLMMARSAAREKEFAVRLAIGAGRFRLIRQSLTEALVLVGAGAALGLVLAIQGQVALAAFFAEGNQTIVLDLSLNVRVLLFTLAVSLLTGLLFGLWPALRSTAVDPGAALQSGSRSVSASRHSLYVGRALMVLQVALSTVLLAGAGLFIRSLQQLQSVDLGFSPEGILTMEVAPEKEWNGTPEWSRAQAAILERVRAIPGVTSAAWSTISPLDNRRRGVTIAVPGFIPKGPRDNDIHLVSVSPEYFATYHIPLLLGRPIEHRDGETASKALILSETAARFYFGDSNPVGKRVGLMKRNDQYEIVGVAKDMKHESVRKGAWRIAYLPIPQSVDRINRLSLAVRTSGDPTATAAPVQKEIRQVASSLLVTNISTIEKQVQLSLMKERLVSTLSVSFGVLALVLACIGLYGILAYAVARRTNEIGIRMALGATRQGMVWLVQKEALILAGCGIAIGLPAAVFLGGLSKTLLYGVEPFDLPALAVTAFLLFAFAVIAAAIPARSASRLDPMAALRID